MNHPHQVLVCDKSGQPHHWAKWKDAILLKYLDCISYEMGDAAVFFGGTSRITGERSHIDVGQIVFLKEVLKYDARTPPLTNDNLFARDMNICAYCGRHFPLHKLSRDHIIPTSKGGKNNWTNCVTACKSCNHHKDDLMLSETDMELLYLPYVPTHAERLLMSNRNVLADQMEFIKGFLPAHSRILGASEVLGLA